MDYDWELRLAAFAALRQIRDRSGGIVTSEALDEGFQFQGERIAFRNTMMGIWRPQQLASDSGAALSVVTVKPRRGQQPRYDDQVRSDEDYFVYRYQGDDPNLWTNKAVRRAFELQRPLIYFYGIAPGRYEPLFPVYVIADDPSELAFHLSPDVESLRPIDNPTSPQLEVQRRYAMRATKVRLHQRRFSELVIDAYGTQCAVCRLRYKELLDAAHIIPDRDERGLAEIPNGLSFCRIHHGAFDANILGIDSTFQIHIRDDILKEKDGPMLKHGLQEMHGGRIHVPSKPAMKPKMEYLEERFAAFRAA
jgi:putative restriction endonuclease